MISSLLMQTGAGLFIPGYSTYRYLKGDLKEKKLPISVLVLDILSFIPTVANGSRLLRTVFRIPGLTFFAPKLRGPLRTGLEWLSEQSGRIELMIGGARAVPTIVIGGDYLLTAATGTEEERQERLWEFYFSALLFGAGRFHQAVASRQTFNHLASKPRHPDPIDLQVNRAGGMFAIPFSETAALTDPQHVDFRNGRAGTALLGGTIFRYVVRYLRLLKHHPGDQLEALRAGKVQVARTVYHGSESEAIAEGLENLKQIPDNAVVVFVGTHTSSWWDFLAPMLVSQNRDGSFNRWLSGASPIADLWNFRASPLARLRQMGRLLETHGRIGFIRRRPDPNLTPSQRRWRLFWEYEFQIQDAIRHPIRAYRAGLFSGFRRYVEDGGRLCRETQRQLLAGDLSALYFPHGTRTGQFFDDHGTVLGSRILSGITHKSMDRRFLVIKNRSDEYFLDLQRAAGDRPVFIVPIARDNPITPPQRRDFSGFFFKEKSALGQTTVIRIGRPQQLDVGGDVLHQVEQSLIETSRIRERLLEITPRVFKEADAPAVEEMLRAAYHRDDHRPFIVLERILAIKPNEAGKRIRADLLKRFQGSGEADWTTLVLEANRILGMG